jgi:hypothetical protein
MTAMWTGPGADELGYWEFCLLRGGGGDKEKGAGMGVLGLTHRRSGLGATTC